MDGAKRGFGDYLIDCIFHGYSFFAAPRANGSPWFLVTLDRGWAALSAKANWRLSLTWFVVFGCVLSVLHQSHVALGPIALNRRRTLERSMPTRVSWCAPAVRLNWASGK